MCKSKLSGLKLHQCLWSKEGKKKKKKEDNQIFTHLHVSRSSISSCFAPCSQSVDGHKVWIKLTVGIGEHSSQLANQLSGSILCGEDNIDPYSSQKQELFEYYRAVPAIALPCMDRGTVFEDHNHLHGCCPR